MRSLPRNFRNNLHTYTVGQLADAYSIVMERARGTEAGSTARTRAVNLASDIREEVFERGFRLVRCWDEGFGYERFGETA